MATDIGSLVASIDADASGFTGGVQEATQNTAEFDDTVQQSQAGLGVWAAAAAAAGVAAAVMFGSRLSSALDEQIKLSRELDIGVDRLRALTDAFGEAGISAGALTAAMTRVEERIGQARLEGGNMAEAIEAAGLQLDQLAGLRADRSLLLVADAIASMDDRAEQARLSMLLLGGSGRRLISVMQDQRQELLDGIAGFERSNAAVGNFSSGLEAMNDAVARVGSSVREMGITALEPLIPVVRAGADAVVRLMRAIRPLVAAMAPLTPLVVGAGAAIATYASTVGTARLAVRGLNAAMVTLGATTASLRAAIVTLTSAKAAWAAATAAAAIAVRGLTAALAFLTGPVGIITAAIGLLAVHATRVASSFAEARRRTQELADAVAEADRAVRRNITPGLDALEASLDDVRQQMRQTVLSVERGAGTLLDMEDAARRMVEQNRAAVDELLRMEDAGLDVVQALRDMGLAGSEAAGGVLQMLAALERARREADLLDVSGPANQFAGLSDAMRGAASAALRAVEQLRQQSQVLDEISAEHDAIEQAILGQQEELARLTGTHEEFLRGQLRSRLEAVGLVEEYDRLGDELSALVRQQDRLTAQIEEEQRLRALARRVEREALGDGGRRLRQLEDLQALVDRGLITERQRADFLRQQVETVREMLGLFGQIGSVLELAADVRLAEDDPDRPVVPAPAAPGVDLRARRDPQEEAWRGRIEDVLRDILRAQERDLPEN